MITVTTTSGKTDELPNAASWHVDEDGNLHIRKANKGNVATYARGLWVCAREAEASTEVVMHAEGVDAEAILKALRDLQKRQGIRSFNL